MAVAIVVIVIIDSIAADVVVFDVYVIVAVVVSSACSSFRLSTTNHKLAFSRTLLLLAKKTKSFFDIALQCTHIALRCL